MLLGNPQDVQEQVLVSRVYITWLSIPCCLLLLSLIGHLVILAGLEAQSPSLEPMETQSELVDRESHTEPDLLGIIL